MNIFLSVSSRSFFPKLFKRDSFCLVLWWLTDFRAKPNVTLLRIWADGRQIGHHRLPATSRQCPPQLSGYTNRHCPSPMMAPLSSRVVGIIRFTSVSLLDAAGSRLSNVSRSPPARCLSAIPPANSAILCAVLLQPSSPAQQADRQMRGLIPSHGVVAMSLSGQNGRATWQSSTPWLFHTTTLRWRIKHWIELRSTNWMVGV